MKKLLGIILMFMSLTGFKPDNMRHITGTVTDEQGRAIPGATVSIKGTQTVTTTNMAGKYAIDVPNSKATLLFSFIGYTPKEVKVGKTDIIDVSLAANRGELDEVVVVGYGVQKRTSVTGSVAAMQPARIGRSAPVMLRGLSSKTAGVYYKNKTYSAANQGYVAQYAPQQYANDESYKTINENGFNNAKDVPLSTFSVDVDAASYSNVRRFINNGQLPPADAIRIEEMVNYFTYNLPGPKDNEPVAIHTELSPAPWNTNHRLLRIGLKARTISAEKLPPSNLVFLIDVSGSMFEESKLPLVKSAMKMLVDQLRAKDKVSIVVYAGNVGLVLPATDGDKKETIDNAIDNLEAGGSTAGGAGIKLAYKVAAENYMKGGNNRVILSTDGDFNVGASSDEDMEQLITKERETGISLSVLGFGMGNYKDSKMETMADKGNGNYAYIDNITEARKTLVSEFGGTLFTVAKDVKLQLEFNPAKVQAYRLIGYEDRMLNKEDFNNDKKDAGDMGSGHTVTALYEIVPAGVKDDYSASVDPLKYQKPGKPLTVSSNNEMLTIKFRYKQPESMVSKLSQAVVMDIPEDESKTSADFKFAAGVAEFGMLLRDSQYKQKSSYDQAINLARAGKGEDKEGYRAEFIKLAETAKLLVKSELASK